MRITIRLYPKQLLNQTQTTIASLHLLTKHDLYAFLKQRKSSETSSSAHTYSSHSDTVFLPLRRYPIIHTFALGVGQKRLPIALHL